MGADPPPRTIRGPRPRRRRHPPPAGTTTAYRAINRYIQATHDVVDARYPCSEQDAKTLAALQVQEEFGDVPMPVDSCSYLKGQLGKYLSAKVLEDGELEAMEENMLKLYAKLAGYSPQEARLSYLDYVKSWKIYGSSYRIAASGILSPSRRRPSRG